MELHVNVMEGKGTALRGAATPWKCSANHCDGEEMLRPALNLNETMN